MTFELVLFVVVAAVAIFSAAFMLISRNAVHSALFLVVNLLCVAFFYLMLNAPFLAMVQITVYAGAIMVLFMFVIMLLGSERLGTTTSKFPWIATGALILTTVFLVTVFVAVVQGQVGALRAIPPQPELRFAHVVAGAPEVDVYLNDQLAAGNVAFGEFTEFEPARAGNYNLLLYPACAEADRSACPNPVTTGASPLLALPVALESEMTTTYLVAGTPTALRLISAPTDLTPLEQDNTFRLTVVNALPDSGPIKLVQLNEADPANSAIIAPVLNYGDVSPTLTLPRDTYDLIFEQGDARLATRRDYSPRNKTHEMLVLAAEPVAGGGTRAAVLHGEAIRTEEAYGSPQQIGLALLTKYLLPFEMVSLLLLGTMVGAIILVREDVVRRVRRRLVVSPAVRRINRAANGGELAAPANPANESADPLPAAPIRTEPTAD